MDVQVKVWEFQVVVTKRMIAARDAIFGSSIQAQNDRALLVCGEHHNNHIMAAHSIAEFDVLEQAQEDALHADRLLAVEERPFKRVTDRVLGKKSTIRPTLTYLPSPPPEGEDGEGSEEYDTQKFRHDVLLDFANLESSLIRIQLILSSNQRERERYAAEKAKILETAQAVRDNTVELRVQLTEAQRVLEQRKGYDEQAAKILDDRKLKSRDETRSDIEKLEKEIEDLQQESSEYEDTWATRREQFDNIVREGEAMIRLIKGIKDEPEQEAEKDEDMEDAEEGEGIKAENSRFNSPGPDGRSPRPTDMGDSTPMPESGEAGGATPRPTNKFLDVDDATRSASRASSPLVQPTAMQDDVDMGESSISDHVATGTSPNTGETLEATVGQVTTPQASTPAPDIAMDDA